MKANDEMDKLFRDRLSGTGIKVRDDFWDTVRRDLPSCPPQVSAKRPDKRPAVLPWWDYRAGAAAAVAFILLGMTAALFWHLSPKEEIKDAFAQAASSASPSPQPDSPDYLPPAAKPLPARQPEADGQPVPEENEEGGSLSVHVTVSISHRSSQQVANGLYPASNQQESTYPKDGASAEEQDTYADIPQEASRPWNVKFAVGTALWGGGFGMPFTAGVGLERRLNRRLSVETGIRYHRLPTGGQAMHLLEIPLKANVRLAKTTRTDFYVSAGGAAEKCVAGMPDNGWKAEPVRLSVAAGIGVRYKLSDRFALFVEPTVSHHFRTASRTKTLRTERPTNLNLLCGLSMAY